MFEITQCNINNQKDAAKTSGDPPKTQRHKPVTESERIKKNILCKQQPREQSGYMKSHTTDFKSKKVIRDKARHYILLIKASIYQQDVTITNIYTFNDTLNMKQK